MINSRKIKVVKKGVEKDMNPITPIPSTKTTAETIQSWVTEYQIKKQDDLIKANNLKFGGEWK